MDTWIIYNFKIVYIGDNQEMMYIDMKFYRITELIGLLLFLENVILYHTIYTHYLDTILDLSGF